MDSIMNELEASYVATVTRLDQIHVRLDQIIASLAAILG